MTDRAKKPVLVTGASKGIGLACARRLGKEGYPVAVHYGRDRAGAEGVAAEIAAAGGTARLLSFDVADREATRATLGAHIAEHGPFWGVVQNAGVSRDRTFAAIEGDD